VPIYIKLDRHFFMEYIQLIKGALKQSREKGKGTYYEAHHIVPKSFNKKSSTVLLTPEEHYQAHKLLAEFWKSHSVYGKKMLWAFHRLTYDKGRKLTKEQYGEARRILQPLWKTDKTMKHKEKISLAMKGNTNNSSRVFKGMKSDITEQGRKTLSKSTAERQTGKKQWSGGPYTVTLEDGTTTTRQSYPDLAQATGIKWTTLQKRLTTNRGKLLKGWKIE
jgi:hypothetical protein